jgi:acyl carrier protein
MAADVAAIKNQIREFIVREYLPGEDPSNLADDQQLRSSGILDSMSTLGLVTWVEKTFGFEVAPNEAADEFHTINDIAALIERKSS